MWIWLLRLSEEWGEVGMLWGNWSDEEVDEYV